VEPENQRPLFYVVKTPDGYFVLELTLKALFERTLEDPALNGRLDQSPFATRAEAEQRRRKLIAEQLKNNP
jgi:hypothetical protein